MAEEQNKEIESEYWKEKANTLLKRFKKYKDSILFYIHDFSIPYDNNVNFYKMLTKKLDNPIKSSFFNFLFYKKFTLY